MWAPGEEILVRSLHLGRVIQAVPARVVQDGPELLATWIAPGTRCIHPHGSDGRRLRPIEAWEARPHVWYGNGNLDLVWPGEAHLLRLFWNDDRSFAGWYFDLQDPIRRTPRGYDSRDCQLDVWVEPDLRWQLKDEDHLASAEEVGLMTPAEVAAARAECERVVGLLPERLPTGWEEWAPDPSWPTPRLPEDWAAD